MTDWEANEEWQFSTTDNVIYALYNVSIGAGYQFKIADEGWEEYNFGGPQNFALNEPVFMELDGDNMWLSEGGEHLNLFFNIETLELIVEEEDDYPVTRQLYLGGDMTDWDVNSDWQFSTTDNVNYLLSNVSLAAAEVFVLYDSSHDILYGAPNDMESNDVFTIELHNHVTLEEGGLFMCIGQDCRNLTFQFNIETLELTVTDENIVNPGPSTGNETVLSTSDVTGIYACYATFNGYISEVGEPTYSERGFCYCYSSYGLPTIYDHKVMANGTGTGTFSVEVNDLDYPAQYKVCAYAIQDGQPIYGNVVSFSTIKRAPSVNTLSVSNIQSSSATLNGNITNSGIPSASFHGFCYSYTNRTPTINDRQWVEPHEYTGNFQKNISGLDKGTTYYVRAFAYHNSSLKI